MAAWLGFAAALLHAAAYALYLRHALRAELRPSPASWLMFAYGTGLVAALEAAAGGPWAVLLLPAVCAGASVLVAARALSARPRAPLDRWDRAAFALDLLLTALWLLGRLGLLPAFDAALLPLAALGSVAAFVPILRSTLRDPAAERPGPWLLWSGAYGLLACATLAGGSAPALLLYPLANLALHGAVALLALRRAPEPGR